MANVISREQDGTWVADQPFVVTCGCGSVVPDARNALRMSGVPDVPMLVSSSNYVVREYIKQIGLDIMVPSLTRPKHAVLFNPKTGQYLDVMNAPRNEDFYVNVYRVASGQ